MRQAEYHHAAMADPVRNKSFPLSTLETVRMHSPALARGTVTAAIAGDTAATLNKAMPASREPAHPLSII